MKKRNLLITVALAALSPLLFLGCEAESTADLELDLSPVSVTMRNGDAQVFNVSGGFNYRWILSNEDLGILNTRVGNQVVYTATSTNKATQILTVQSIIQGASQVNNTNAATTNLISNNPSIISAFATIKQLGN